MISVSLTTLITLSMVAGVGFLAVVWLIAIFHERRNDTRSRQDLIQCRICGVIFENTERKSIIPCPACGSLNEATRPSPI